MALARVVSFEDVSNEQIEAIKKEITENDPPGGMSPTEIIVLHDSGAEKALVVVFFETEDDYKQGDEVLSAMPANEVPGKRASVTKYEVAVRRAP
jgi:hypothetical protein